MIVHKVVMFPDFYFLIMKVNDRMTDKK